VKAGIGCQVSGVSLKPAPDTRYPTPVSGVYPNFSFCRFSKNSDHASPFFLSRAGTFLTVKSEIFTPFSICFQVNGIEIVALGLARAVNTDARLLPRAFC